MSHDPKLVPEIYVRDIAQSLAFYTDILGFDIVYDRPEEGFAYLDRRGAHLMLDQIGESRTWISGDLDIPFGRGINFQIETDDVDGLYQHIIQSGGHIFLEIEDKWYRAGDVEVGSRQFIVSDPDGYLLRFYQDMGERPYA